MNKKDIFNALVVAVFVLTCASSWAMDAGNLIDKYNENTTVQKMEFERQYEDKQVSVDGVVSDVKEEETFDVVTDTGSTYYTVITKTQKSLGRNQYKVIVVYRDASKAQAINKDQKIEVDGKLLGIVDERLVDSVWIYAEDLTPKEKARFKKFLRRASY